jgi:CelD/BcsL family acetyltransferase involved in cellulose biosynthesis
MYDTTLRAVKQTNPSAALVKYVIISDTVKKTKKKKTKKEFGTRRKERGSCAIAQSTNN